MTPPELSTTVPERDVKKLPCACAAALTARVRTAASTSRITLIYRSLLETNRLAKNIKEATNVSGCLVWVNADLLEFERRPDVFRSDPANRSAARSVASPGQDGRA